MKKKFVFPVLLMLMILITTGYFYNLFSFAERYWGWVTGDWLINFSGGFVRRGLSGYTMMKLSDLFNVKLNYIVMWVQILFYAGFMVLLFLLFYKKKINTWFIICLLSPSTLLFAIFDPNAAGRKEIILFLLFALYVWCMRKKMLRLPTIFLFSMLLLVATLFHELVFLFTPYFILAAYVESKVNNTPFVISRPLLVIAGSCLAVIPVFLFGMSVNGDLICSGLKERGLPDSICLGALSWPVNYGWNDVIQFAREANYLFVYGSALLLSLIPFIIHIRFLKHPSITLKKFVVAGAFLFLFSAPLFLFAVDWGRWLHIHFMLLLIMSTILLENQASNGWQEQQIILPQILPSKTNFLKRSGKIVFALLVLAYVGTWSMPHFGASKVFSLKKNFYSIKHLATDILEAIF